MRFVCACAKEAANAKMASVPAIDERDAAILEVLLMGPSCESRVLLAWDPRILAVNRVAGNRNLPSINCDVACTKRNGVDATD